MANFFRGIIDEKILSVIKLFLENEKDLFHLNKISESTDVPIATTYRIVNKLLKLNFIEKKNVGKMKIYTLASNQKTQFFKEILK